MKNFDTAVDVLMTELDHRNNLLERLERAERLLATKDAALAHARQWICHEVSGRDYQQFLDANLAIENPACTEAE